MAKAIYHTLQDVSYQAAWDIQTQYHEELKRLKKEADTNNDTTYEPVHHLIFCEHSPVYTLGKSGKMDHLLLDRKELNDGGMEFHKINRGGDITYHGPGQVTGYPIFDMDYMYKDIRKYVSDLEDIIITLLEGYGIKGARVPKYTGVWITDRKPYRKICAIGVHMSRWVTLHGFAFNVSTELSYFNNIVPCGIVDEDKAVTSLSHELGETVPMEKVMKRLKALFQKKFDLEYVND